MKFRNRLMLVLFIVALVPTLLVGFYQYNEMVENRRHQQLFLMKDQWGHRLEPIKHWTEELSANLESFLTSYDFLQQYGTRAQEPFVESFQGQSEDKIEYWLEGQGKAPVWVLEEMSQAPYWIGPFQGDTFDSKVFYYVHERTITVQKKRMAAAYQVHEKRFESLLGPATSDYLVLLMVNGEPVYGDPKAFEAKDQFKYAGNRVVPLEDNHYGYYRGFSSGAIDVYMTGEGLIQASTFAQTATRLINVLFIPLCLAGLVAYALTTILFWPLRRLVQWVQRVNNKDYRLEAASSFGLFQEIAIDVEQATISYQQGQQALQSQIDIIESATEAFKQVELHHGEVKKKLSEIKRSLGLQSSSFYALLQSLDDMVWITDENGKIIYITDKVEQMLGYPAEHLVDQSINELIALPNVEIALQSDIINQTLDMKCKNGMVESFVTNTIRIQIENQSDIILGIGRSDKHLVNMQRRARRRTKELKNIRAITRQLASKHEMDDLLDVVLVTISDLYDIAAVNIHMLDENKMLSHVKTAGPFVNEVPESSIDPDADIRGTAMIDQKLMVEKQLMEIMFSDPLLMKPFLRHVGSAAFIPIIIDGEGVGVISIWFRTTIGESDLDMLNALAIQSTIAIEKSRLYSKQQEEFVKTIGVLATAIDAKDAYTVGHSHRVSQFALTVGRKLGLDAETLVDVEIAGILHDIGKIGIPDSILAKEGKLTGAEFAVIKEHPEIGSRILSPIGFSDNITLGVLLHHKRYDGTGYPETVDSGQPPLISFIIGAADALDAMTSNRSYTVARSLGAAVEELKRCSGTQFHPEVIKVIDHMYQNEPDILQEIIAGKG